VSQRNKFALWLLVGGPIAVFSLWAMFDNTRLYFVTLLNSLTLATMK
jgi:branched-chain amino acid transport system permease protein